jgi:glycosyltransferase involved in cell wall biosynthesis
LFLTQTLQKSLQEKSISLSVKTVRKNRLYKGFFAHLKLLWFGYKHANCNVNIVVARLGLSAILRNAFNKNKIIVVIHNFDNCDGKSLNLKWYYKLLFKAIKHSRPNKVMLITVAKYWQNFFANMGIKQCHVFYNFFEQSVYDKHIGSKKLKQIHLGQFSWKNDNTIKNLAENLHKLGYFCYFSTNNKLDELNSTTYYAVIYEEFDAYLKRMSESLYTLALTTINEGWNRVAHESMLVKTPVIGYAGGGLGELLQGSNAHIVTSTKEAFNIIINQTAKPINTNFLKTFDASNAAKNAKPILDWILE